MVSAQIFFAIVYMAAYAVGAVLDIETRRAPVNIITKCTAAKTVALTFVRCLCLKPQTTDGTQG